MYLQQYQLSAQLRGHENAVNGICICGASSFATSSHDRTIRFWNRASSDKRKYRTSKILTGHTSSVEPLAWIPPNEEFPQGGIVSGGMDALVMVWDLRNGESVFTLSGHQWQVTGVVIDNEDIVSSSADCTLRRWRKGEAVESWEAHKQPIQAVIKLPSGEFVTGSSDTTIKFWRGKTCLRSFAGHTSTVRSLAIMRDFGILSASFDGSIRLWPLTGEFSLNMVGHTSPVFSVDSHASGLIISSSEDCTAKIWKADGFCLQSLEHPGCVWDAKFMENGDIVTACSDGVVRVWTLHVDKVADPVDIESHVSQLSQFQLSRVRAETLKLDALSGLEASHALAAVSTKQSFKHIPRRRMLSFDAAQFDEILKKFNEFNTALMSDGEKKSLSLSEVEISRVDVVFKILKDTSCYHNTRFADNDIALLLRVVASWPLSMLYPVIDILRMTVPHPDGARIILKHINSENDILMEMIKKITANPPVQPNLVAGIRLVTNLFPWSSFHNWLQKHRSEIFDVFSSSYSFPYNDLQVAYAAMILNYAVLLIHRKDLEGQSQVLFSALEIAQDEKIALQSKYWVLVAIGSLMHDGHVRKIALDFDVQNIAKLAKASKETKIAEVGSDIELLTKQN